MKQPAGTKTISTPSNSRITGIQSSLELTPVQAASGSSAARQSADEKVVCMAGSRRVWVGVFEGIVVGGLVGVDVAVAVGTGVGVVVGGNVGMGVGVLVGLGFLSIFVVSV